MHRLFKKDPALANDVITRLVVNQWEAHYKTCTVLSCGVIDFNRLTEYLSISDTAYVKNLLLKIGKSRKSAFLKLFEF